MIICRVPGQHFAGKHESGRDITYDARDHFHGDIPAGWFASLEEAVAAAFPSTEPVAVADVPPAIAEAADDVPPTRAELEAKAAELGIKVDKRWSDKTLTERIVSTMEKAAEG
jgi:hypothetical protein